MLAKRTVKNQITLPKAVAQAFPGVEYFRVTTQGRKIVLEPVETEDKAAAVRRKLAALGISQKDIADAVQWARQKKR